MSAIIYHTINITEVNKLIEYEKKFLLTKEEYLKLISSLCVNITPIIQTNHYYDTDNFELNDQGITCRIREKNNKFTATIKTHLSDKSLEQSKIVTDENDISLFSNYNVDYQGKLTTHRTKLFCGDGYEIVIDRNEYLSTEDYELEAEYTNENEDVLTAPLKLISNILNIDINDFYARSTESKNKSQRFFNRKKELYDFIKPQKMLETILHFRNSSKLDIDEENENRFCVTVNEKDGSKTGYYFSTPIYNKFSNNIVDNEFTSVENGFIAVGSNSIIKIFDSIQLEGNDGFAKILLDKKVTSSTPTELSLENDRIFLTTNGILYVAELSNKSDFSFDIIVDNPFLSMRSNNQCLVLLKDGFIPFLSISCLGASDTYKYITEPAVIKYQKITDIKYNITISPYNNHSKYLFFEVNSYEHKAVQDTTVESATPQKNNAFGGVAFVGNSKIFGEQWLYSKIDFYTLREISNKKIKKAIWHIPKYNNNFTEIDVFELKSRFCSFGSNWENKNEDSTFLGSAVDNGNYIDIDITKVLINAQDKESMLSEGIILKPGRKQNEYTIISTGDNYFRPQLIEVNYI